MTTVIIDGHKSLEIAAVAARFEPCPPFEEGASKAGKWSVSYYKGEYGASFSFFYDSMPVMAEFFTVFFGSFDFNEFKGKPTESCKLGGCVILVPSLPPAAKEVILQSFAQVRADQAVVKDAFEKFLAANKTKFPLPVDDSRQPIPRNIRLAARLKFGKEGDGGKGKEKVVTDVWQIASSLDTERGDKDVRKNRITTPIIIDGIAYPSEVSGVKYPTLTRGTLYEKLKGGTYLKHSKGRFSAFEGPGGCFIQFKSEEEALQQLPRKKMPTSEEMQKMVVETSSIFAKLGIEMRALSKEEMEEEEEGSEVKRKAAPPAAPPADAAPPAAAPPGTVQVMGAGAFVKLPKSEDQ